jgi:hypothetical protein
MGHVPYIETKTASGLSSLSGGEMNETPYHNPTRSLMKKSEALSTDG